MLSADGVKVISDLIEDLTAAEKNNVGRENPANAWTTRTWNARERKVNMRWKLQKTMAQP